MYTACTTDIQWSFLMSCVHGMLSNYGSLVALFMQGQSVSLEHDE